MPEDTVKHKDDNCSMKISCSGGCLLPMVSFLVICVLKSLGILSLHWSIILVVLFVAWLIEGAANRYLDNKIKKIEDSMGKTNE